MAEPPVEVKIRGVRQLEAGAARLFRNIETATSRDAVKVTADQAAATIRSRVPRLTGRLAATVRSEQNGSRGSVVMGAGLPYARWIEFGGGRGRPYRPRGRYIYPTAKRTERAFRKHCEDATNHAIGGMHWPTPQ